MCYPDRRYYITFFFQLYRDFQKSTHADKNTSKGRPQVYPESSLIIFFAIMMIRRIHRFKAQHDFLVEHSEWVKRLKFEGIPSRTTLSRRYKRLTATVEKFVEYIGDFGITLDTETPVEVVFEDKSLYKAQGPVWHQKDRKADHIPEGLRNLDTDASWATSKYCGWVYGYALHLTTTIKGLPRLASVHTASVSEKAGFDEKTDALVSKNIKYIVADAGYTDFDRIEALAKEGLFLLTPITNAKAAKKVAYLQTIQNSPELRTYQAKRKTAIEPMFSLLTELTGTENNRKQLPVKGIENVKSFLMIATLLLQIARVVNSIYNLPDREVSRMITLFQ